MDPVNSANTYWSILKTLLSNKKIPCIPTLFHQGKLTELTLSLPNNVP